MQLTVKDVEYVAELARLEFSAEEKEMLAGQLSEILKYVEKLNEVNTDAVKPTSHVVPLANVMRPDEARASLPAEDTLKNAPDQARGSFRVPRIIE